jgi:hypothetical protein
MNPRTPGAYLKGGSGYRVVGGRQSKTVIAGVVKSDDPGHGSAKNVLTRSHYREGEEKHCHGP